jgi:short-subunit dehydrogenase
MNHQKVVVITGASSGAGRAIANEAALQGMQLVLAARREEALEEVALECEELGGKTLIVPTDMQSAEEVHHLARKAFEFGGRIDVWINNAGVLAAGELDKIPAEINEAVIRTNLLGYIQGAHAVLPYFKKQGHGILINNISVGGWFPTPYMAAYSASKFGLRGFFESLKGELTPYPDIHVCDLYPGFLDTPGIQHTANYTGKNLKPAPPVYDPRKVARVAVEMIFHPKGKQVIGASSAFLRLAFQLFPTLSRNITASVIRTYLKNADPLENSSGNVLSTVDYGRSIDGGWRSAVMPPQTKKKVWLAVGIAAGLMLLNRR